MKSVSSILSIFVSVGLVALAVACTKTVTRVVPAETDAGSDGGKLPPAGDDDDTSGDDDTGDDDDDASTPVKDAGPPNCKKTTTQATCATCCGDQHKTGFKTYQTAIKECVCAPDVCQTQCKATYCLDKPTTQACATCVNTEQANCQDAVTAKCGEDEDCVAWNECAMTAGCQSKPVQ